MWGQYLEKDMMKIMPSSFFLDQNVRISVSIIFNSTLGRCIRLYYFKYIDEKMKAEGIQITEQCYKRYTSTSINIFSSVSFP